MTRSNSIEYIGKLLQNFGYKADPIDEDAVGSAASGLRFYIQSYDESIQFRAGISLEGNNRERWLEFVNQYNTDIRFSKAYIEPKGDLVIEADWWLDAEDANHVERFRQCIDFWELALASLKERLRNFASASSDIGPDADEDIT